MKVKVYQMMPEKDHRNLKFMSLDFVSCHGGVDASEYELIFDGEVNARDLEDVYVIFNDYAKMPAGYRGHSLSVSDVVVTDDGAYFCDKRGFAKLPIIWEVA